MKKIAIAFLILCNSVQILAQNPGEIKGNIIDAKTKEALPGATIFVDYMGSKIATIAGSDGSFTLKPLSPGYYNVQVTFIGYDTVTYPNTLVNSDKTTFLQNTEMFAGIYMKIIDVKPPIDQSQTSVIFIPRNVINAMPDGKNISSVLRNTCSDIYVSDDGDDIYFRGSRDGDAAYYVDGVKLRDNNLHIPGNAIGSVAVYTGGVPANYGDFTGGVVVVETKSYFSWANEQKAKERKEN